MSDPEAPLIPSNELRELTREELESLLVTILRGAGKPLHQEIITDAVVALEAWRSRLVVEHELLGMVHRGEILPSVTRDGLVFRMREAGVTHLEQITVTPFPDHDVTVSAPAGTMIGEVLERTAVAARTASHWRCHKCSRRNAGPAPCPCEGALPFPQRRPDQYERP